MAGFFSKLKEGLTKTRQNFVEKVEEVFTGRKKIDEELYEELEEVLIRSDVGVNTSFELVERLRKEVKQRKLSDPNELTAVLQELIAELLGEESSLTFAKQGPTIILVVGVNGVGKTTTIGKLANWLKRDGKRVIMAAGDTFRAAAIDQLEVWGERSGVEVIKQREGADPAAVAYDAVQAAKSRNVDVVIVDTAGRLHNKVNLMEELRKVKRVMDREIPGAPHEVLLVLDATTGQNALQQAKLFQEVAGVTGIVLTKLDGTAKGGVVLGIQGETHIPVKWIGIGEGMEDLRPFVPEDFASALFGTSQKV
ncbi:MULTISPECIES: signal recognition particle-docking protein FtsY [Desulfosporosinus]|uniref:Signal recognition particle receptor FtsY n=2 Tax=Desulfosporosinus TaxID=79206 RepID=A0A1M5UCI6_9FIRM|nr:MULTISPECIES: signal recognition particle-docking protein FtsY [Desulfosporosinus]MCO1601125.1 signal recognition particle-docking protein FtsY [Desulfosporosinus nitroreducens]MDO0821629.1 signal recognition particle-docking protein FtsY [Desulfosporosinus nitroreducens]SHH60546.1 fused signal recognition particle receptor [Desulfosporosinus lacus DSM 15449]